MSNAVVVFSGGLDSTYCLYKAATTHDRVLAVTFDYSQKHDIEIQSAKNIVDSIKNINPNVSHKIIKLPEFISFTGSSLLKGVEGKLDWDNGQYETFVPLRNLIFANIAANLGHKINAKKIYMGISSADHYRPQEYTLEWLCGFLVSYIHENKTAYTPKYEKILENGLLIENFVPDDIIPITNWIHNGRAERNCSYYESGKFSTFLTNSLVITTFDELEKIAQQNKILPTIDFVIGLLEGCLFAMNSLCQIHANKKTIAGGVFDENANYFMTIDINDLFNNFFVQRYSSIIRIVFNFYERVLQKKPEPQHHILSIPINKKFMEFILSRIRMLNTWKFLYKMAFDLNDKNIRGLNPPYHDCTPWFAYSLNQSLVEALGHDDMVFETPLLFRNKCGVIAEAVIRHKTLYKLWSLSHTAYDGSYPPKNEDASSKLRAEAFKLAMVMDPLVIRSVVENKLSYPRYEPYNLYEKVNSVDAALKKAIKRIARDNEKLLMLVEDDDINDEKEEESCSLKE